MTSPSLSHVYPCRPKARPGYQKCALKSALSPGALAGTSPCIIAALMTFCSYESFLSQTDWRSITESPTSYKISRLDFTCKLWIVPLTTYQLCIMNFTLCQGWVSKLACITRLWGTDSKLSWKSWNPGKQESTCYRKILVKAVCVCCLILRWNFQKPLRLLPTLPSSVPFAFCGELRAVVFCGSKCGKGQDFERLCCNSDSNWRMNQLQSLLHDSLIATGHVQHCAIIRRKDTSLRASTVGFSVRLTHKYLGELLR